MGMCPLVRPFRPCPRCRTSPSAGGPGRAGWRQWITRCICAMRGAMAALISIFRPTLLVLKLQDVGFSSRWRRRATNLPFGLRKRLVKRLPVPRSGRTGDDPERLSALHPARGVGCPSTVFCPWGKTKSDSRLYGVKEPDLCLHLFVFADACLACGQVRKNGALWPDKDARRSEEICCMRLMSV